MTYFIEKQCHRLILLICLIILIRCNIVGHQVFFKYISKPNLLSLPPTHKNCKIYAL